MRFIFLPLLLLVCLINSLHAQWTQTSGPAGGSITTLAAGDGTLLVGTTRGLFRSSDNGESWKFAGLGTQRIQAAMVRGNVLLAASDSNRIYRSTDDGASWEVIPTFGAHSQFRVYMTANDRYQFLIFWESPQAGLYRSADTGKSWTKINSLLQWSGNVFCVTSNGTDILIGGYGGVLRSSNNGEDWRFFQLRNSARMIAASGPLAIAYEETSYTYFSRDSGKSWDSKNITEQGYGGQSGIAILNGSMFLAAADGLYRSIDSGQTWKMISPNTANSLYYFTSLLGYGNRLFCGTIKAGIQRSIDSGATWIPSSEGIIQSSSYTITRHGDAIFASTDGGIYRSDNSGASWQYSGLKDDIHAFASDGEWIYAGTVSWLNEDELFGIYRSSDGGTTWQPANSGLRGDRGATSGSFYSYSLGVYAIHATKNSLFAGTDNGLFQSSDHGASWNAIDTGDHWAFQPIRAFAGNDSILYLGSGGRSYSGIDIGDLFRSTDDGITWQRTGLGYAYPVTAITVDQEVVWAGVSGKDSAGLYYSTDQGNTWSKITFPGGVGNVAVYALRHAQGILYAATAKGIYYKRDKDNSRIWKSYNDGFPSGTIVNAFLEDETGIYAATLGSGVWYRSRSDIASVDNARQPASFTLNEILHNPSANDVTISYSLLASGRVTLRLYEMQGTEVRVLSDEVQSSGEHRLSADIGGIPSGMYYVSLQHGEQRVMKKIAIVR